MNRFLYWLRDPRFWSLVGVLLVITFAFVSAKMLKTGLLWVAIIAVLALCLWAGIWWWRRRKAQQSAEQISDILNQQADRAIKQAPNEKRAEVQALRERMQEAVKKIKTSKLGEVSGSAALYELPWYIIIGNPAAGKSTAIVNSGLRFPFSDKTGNVIQGIGGTRNCDWFFTTEGILLDTAGRYSVYEEDRKEWLGFLGLLKKARHRAPINGILIAVSIAELTQNKPEYAINLAKNLRQRVQELTENLEIFAPVYVLFTKVDLISGFVEFFEDADVYESERVWGSTLSYDPQGKGDVVAAFDERFEELYDGLRDMSVARMAFNRGHAMPPGLITFPYEFAAIKPALRAFLATLFEDNPFQYKPIFRGFYFTSAVQEGSATSQIPEKIAQRFSLNLNPVNSKAQVRASHGFFLKDLFSKVIFADKALVRQHTTRRKRQLRLAGFFASVTVLAILLGGWTWSYFGNQRLVENVRADLQKIIKLQEGKIDLASRLESLEILQDRITQLRKFREETPFSVGLGLYQGETLEKKLRNEYFYGIGELLLKPVTSNLESFLKDVNANAGRLQPVVRGAEGDKAAVPATMTASVNNVVSQYKESSPTNPDDAYNALKTYIMLASHDHLDSAHLNDQVTRFWRTWLENNRGNMPREQMIRSAERVLNFLLAQTGDADFPIIENRLTLVDQTRDTLRAVVKGIPARERVYAEIRLRASTRYAPVNVAWIVGEENKDLLAGSYQISGAFTRDAWENYVQGAIKDAANKELQTTDWVLKTSARDDLTLEGSPEQIQKMLTSMYKAEYVQEWKKFVQGITVLEFPDFEKAVSGMNRLGDPAVSPLNRLMETLYRETAWDNPSLLNESMGKAKKGVWEWLKGLVNRSSPVSVQIEGNPDRGGAQVPMGPIGKEFSAVSQLMVSRSGGNETNLMKGYLKLLSKLRTRFNDLKNNGDIGPGSKELVQKTLDGSGSELGDALRYVDEQMLVGASDSAKSTLRPMLVRPLMQAFAVLLKPAERELNKIWLAQVYEPFASTIGTKYPFALDARVEATAAEISQFFGSDGAIAHFADKQLGALVVRRGDAVSPRTWAEMSIQLVPAFINDFSRYVAPLGGGQQAAASAEPQTRFQLLPIPTPGLAEYSIEVDGQVMRYRNGAQQWNNFVWPNPSGQPGARITAVTYDGRSVEVLNIPGRYGLEKMVNSAHREKKEGGIFEFSWSNSNNTTTVKANFRLISSPQTETSGAPREQGLRGIKLPQAIAGE